MNTETGLNSSEFNQNHYTSSPVRTKSIFISSIVDVVSAVSSVLITWTLLHDSVFHNNLASVQCDELAQGERMVIGRLLISYLEPDRVKL